MVRATRRVAPVSAWTSGTSSAAWGARRSASRASSAARSSGGVRLQAGNASAAARAAAATWSTDASGARPTTCLGRRVDDVVGAPAAGDPVAPHQQGVLVAHGPRLERVLIPGNPAGMAQN